MLADADRPGHQICFRPKWGGGDDRELGGEHDLENSEPLWEVAVLVDCFANSGHDLSCGHDEA